MEHNRRTFRRTVAWVIAVFGVLFLLAGAYREYISKPMQGAFVLAAILLVGAVLLFAVDRITPTD